MSSCRSGVAQRQSGDKDLESLIAKADVNLFRAKQDGGNGFVSDTRLGPVGGPDIAAIR